MHLPPHLQPDHANRRDHFRPHPSLHRFPTASRLRCPSCTETIMSPLTSNAGPRLSSKRARPRVFPSPAFITALRLPLRQSPPRLQVCHGLPIRVHPTRILALPCRPTAPVRPTAPTRSPAAPVCLSAASGLRENLTTVSEPVLRAVDSLSRQPRQTVADIAAAAGIPLEVASTEAVKLAALTGASIDVTSSGDIAYRFPRDVRSTLRTRSTIEALAQFWRRVSPALFVAARVAFGALLVISIVVTFLALAAISTAGSRSDDDRRSDRSSGGGFMFAPRFFFGPDIFDVIFYSRYYGRSRRPGTPQRDEMSFLESVYSFVFGDGDPNFDFEERRFRSVAAVIRANRGAVTAEQLAPLLDPPPLSARGTGDGSNLVDETFVLPALTRFEGRPEVTDDGDIIYVFPQFMRTGSRSGSVEMVGARGSAPAVETEQALTLASGTQRFLVVALGLVNLFGVTVLGSQLLTVVPVTQDAAQLVSLLRGIYPALFAYATSFFAVPLLRFLRLKKTNVEIKMRNDARAERARVMVAGGGPGVSPEELRRKIRAAEEFAVKGGRVSGDDVVYSSDRDVIDQPKAQEELTDDFDRRLNG